ncbi:MAG: methyltransferase domain-containing protein [Oscillospiraceae bacterium]|nr:methyltransferase domain-containing protein [Oscillospiraceae bacterium]
MNCEILICPVCGGALAEQGRSLRCGAGHCFDLAKEGYVNLLTGSKPADARGDSKEAARCRRDFLNKGWYAPLRDALTARFAGRRGALLDLCCGEGWYTAALAALPGLEVWGFDLSREMVRLAAKRNAGLNLFVANLARIPVRDAAFDWATLLFAPFQEKELLRVLKPGGRLVLAVPGRRHLYGLKQAVYDRPYENDEALPRTERLRLVETVRAAGRITLRSREDIQAVFRMTPYYYRSSPADRAKLDALETLETEIEFVIAEYEKSPAL